MPSLTLSKDQIERIIRNKAGISETWRSWRIFPVSFSNEYIAVIVNEYGKGRYDIHGNNCEHFAKAIILGINYSKQGNVGLKPFSSKNPLKLKDEIKACSQFFSGLTTSSSEYRDLVYEIRQLTREDDYGAWGD